MLIRPSLRRQRHRDREFVRQSLYKAQNLGFYANIYVDELIARYSASVAAASAFARAGSVRQARLHLASQPDSFAATGPRAQPGTSVHVAAPSTLQTLAFVADAHLLGWRLLLEDCPFSTRFLRPLLDHRRSSHVQFHPIKDIPAIWREAIAEPIASLAITFPDRPFDTRRACIEERLLGQSFLISIAEILLAHSRATHAFRLGQTLQPVNGRVPGATVLHRTQLEAGAAEQAYALDTVIRAAPIEYLGWESLYSRSGLYYQLITVNRRRFFASVLRYCQSRPTRLPSAQYQSLLAAFQSNVSEERPAKATAPTHTGPAGIPV